MRAIFRHEISSCFTNLTGYVFGAFLLLFAGIFTMVYNLNYQVANFEYVVSEMSFVFLIIVPILTMRVLAEERRQKTDQLLYSLPLSMTQVVLGKYAALLCMLLIPTAILCLYPIALSTFGDIYFPAAFGAIAGFFFLGAALTAIGVFVSSVTESQAVAAGLRGHAGQLLSQQPIGLCVLFRLFLLRRFCCRHPAAGGHPVADDPQLHRSPGGGHRAGGRAGRPLPHPAGRLCRPVPGDFAEPLPV